jgi:hypothetical protein
MIPNTNVIPLSIIIKLILTTHLALLRGINVWAQYDKMDAL